MQKSTKNCLIVVGLILAAKLQHIFLNKQYEIKILRLLRIEN